MKIGVLFDKQISDGGGFQIEYAIINALNEYSKDFEVTLFTNASNIAFEKRLPNLKFVYLCSGFLGKIYQILGRFFSLLERHCAGFYFKYFIRLDYFNRLLKKHKIDLMYFLGPSALASRIEVPFLFTVWDLQHRIQPEFPEVRLGGVWERREKLYKHALKRAFAVVADSETGKRDVEYYYRVNPAKVISAPFIHNLQEEPDKPTTSNIKEKYSIDMEFIFYPAQFWPHKNHVTVLKAIKSLKARGVNIALITSGSDKGNLPLVLEKAKLLGVSDHFHYLGFVSDEELKQLYRQALALVMPTFFGPTNIPIYEAFALGCPVITSDLDGIRDQVGDAGVVVPPTDEHALASAIHRMLEDSQFRSECIANGKVRSSQWSSHNYFERINQLFVRYDAVMQNWK